METRLENQPYRQYESWIGLFDDKLEFELQQIKINNNL